MKLQYRYTKPVRGKHPVDIQANELNLSVINEALYTLMTMNMDPGSRDAVVQKNLHQWRKDRAEAQATKAERQRKQRVRRFRNSFNRGFNSISELLP